MSRNAVRRASLIASVILVACIHAANPSTDLPARMKAISGPVPFTTTSVEGTIYYYSVNVWRAPRGYQTTLTLAEKSSAAPTLTATIYQRIGDRQLQILKLVDEGADGTLDYVLIADGPSITAASAVVNSGRVEKKRPDQAMRATYATLVDGLRAETVNPFLAAAKH